MTACHIPVNWYYCRGSQKENASTQGITDLNENNDK
jgi:hypothetical protein